MTVRMGEQYVANGALTQAGYSALRGTEMAVAALQADVAAQGVEIDALQDQAAIFYRPNAALAGANVTTTQSVFALSVTLAASTIYAYDLFFSLTKTAGTTSHSISVGYGGTATLNNIHRNILGSATLSTATTNNAIGSSGLGYLLTAAQTAVVAGLNTANVNFWYRETGTVSIAAGGTFIPQYQLSAAPGGAYSTNLGSFFSLRRLGAAGGDVSFGSWA